MLLLERDCQLSELVSAAKRTAEGAGGVEVVVGEAGIGRTAIPGAGNVRPTYITDDNEQSIAEKGWYVRRNGLGGVMIWTISEGYLSWKTSGEKDPLMKAIVAAFRQP